MHLHSQIYFTSKNSSLLLLSTDIKKIVFKCNFNGISCLVIYQDGHEFNALNKNSGVTVKNTIWLIILLFFVILPISLCLLDFIITGGAHIVGSVLDSGVDALF